MLKDIGGSTTHQILGGKVTILKQFNSKYLNRTFWQKIKSRTENKNDFLFLDTVMET